VGKRQALILAALALLVAAIYAPVAGFGFVVEYDDAQYILRNPQVLAGVRTPGVAWAFTSVGYAANWHPLTWLSHMADASLFGAGARGPHVVSVVLHGLNAALLFAVLRGLTGSLWRSALAAALFAAHPLQVESVAWVAERKNVLSTLFGLLALAAHLAHRRRPGPGRYALVVAALAAGLLAKPMLVTLPFVLLLLDFWPLGALGWRGRRGAVPPRRVALEALPLLALAAASSLVTLRAQAAGAALATLEKLPLADRVANALESWVAYARLAAWPAGLSVFHRFDPAPLLSARVLGAAALLAGVSALALAGARRRPWLAVGWCWYVGTLVPVIGLVQVGDQGLAERYAYVPIVGLIVAAVWSLPARRPGGPFPAAVAAAGVAAVLALATAASAQVGYWRDGGTLFGRAVAVDPRSHVAHNNLGVFLRARGRDAEALEHFSRAAELRPAYADAHYNLGILLYERGRLDAAAAQYRAALAARPDYEEARCNLGAILVLQGRYAEAEAELREALRQKPDDTSAQTNLALALRRGK
jgi:tetratricopeptide (TPR) repeat protein